MPKQGVSIGPTTRSGSVSDMSISADSSIVKSLQENVKKMQTFVCELQSQFNKLSNELNNKITQLCTDFMDVKNTITSFKQDFEIQLANVIKSCESIAVKHSDLDKRITTVERCTQYHQDQNRMKDAVLIGIPAVPGENVDNIYNIIINKLKHKPAPYTDVFRIKSRANTNNKSHLPIVIKFTTMTEKRQFISTFRSTQLKLSDIGFSSDAPIRICDSTSRNIQLLIPTAYKLFKENKISRYYTHYNRLIVTLPDGSIRQVTDIDFLNKIATEKPACH